MKPPDVSTTISFWAHVAQSNIYSNLEPNMNEDTINELIKEDERRRKDAVVKTENKLNHIS